MKILVYEWTLEKSFWCKYDVRDTLHKLNVNVVPFHFDFDAQGQEELETLFERMEAKNCDACFSVNYFPKLSDVCQKTGIKYIAWGYDCPFNVCNIEDTLGNACNYVFCFDRNQALQYRQMGFDTVYHLPLGVNVDRYRELQIPKGQKSNYVSDISFVGNMYKGEYSGLTEICDERTQGYLEGVIESQLLLYGAYILNDVIHDNLIDQMNNYFQILQPGTKFRIDKSGLVHMLDQETSRRERLLLRGLLGKRFDVHVYTYKQDEMLKNVICHGGVDYLKEMPRIFAKSKINLNITVKGIQSGIPLRALDVMASGGFLLSNYQAELVEYFSYGQDMVVYESIADAYEKCKYFLQHDEEREKIAENGRRKVFEEHNMTDKFIQMLTVAKIQ